MVSEPLFPHLKSLMSSNEVAPEFESLRTVSVDTEIGSSAKINAPHRVIGFEEPDL